MQLGELSSFCKVQWIEGLTCARVVVTEGGGGQPSCEACSSKGVQEHIEICLLSETHAFEAVSNDTLHCIKTSGVCMCPLSVTV